MGRLEIKSWDEVPEFENEAQEAGFWATHYLSEALAEEAQVVDPITFELLEPRKKSATRRTA
ncbi:MAG: hypothetical protein IVW51_09460 [Thermaceae bacterium]|nr:hypothetical protein [Thermaceae bacterium]